MSTELTVELGDWRPVNILPGRRVEHRLVRMTYDEIHRHTIICDDEPMNYLRQWSDGCMIAFREYVLPEVAKK